ncbi:MAG: hypothetical protein QF579_00020 [Dehalococcoidia bacterium]|jgi:hypothetical protein|nr:hypothetical protein [Dehalococcoidia bacterium]
MSLLRIPVEWQNWKSTIGASKATSHGDFEKPASGLQRQFRFLIDMGAYHFLYVVQEEVISYEDWCAPPWPYSHEHVALVGGAPQKTFSI